MREDSLLAMSALLDGECADAELDKLLEEMERSPELALHWSRLCQNRDIRQGMVPSETCICAGVMARLDEPEQLGTNVRPFAARFRALRVPRWATPVSGLVAAASMGAAAVMFVQPQTSSQQTPVPTVSPLVASGESINWARSPAVVPGVTKVSSKPSAVVGGGLDDPHDQLLREYLIDHSNAVATEGMGGTMRYARFAAHEAEYRPMTLDIP